MFDFDRSRYGFRTIFPIRSMSGEDDWDSYDYYFNTFAELMEAASKFYAFSDDTDEDIIFIYARGKAIYYCGWMPDMEYKFVDEDGEVVWDFFYPEWEH